jgi:hypothetical protein
MTVKVLSAIVTVPLRENGLGFDATLKETVALPVLLAPPVTVIQATLLAAVHAHVAGAVTLVDPVAPLPATD